MQIEVAYALPAQQVLLTINVASGTTALQAVYESGVLTQHPEIDVENIQLGIFSRKVMPETVLQPGDRVEIYRPLIIDPMQKRRQRAKC